MRKLISLMVLVSIILISGCTDQVSVENLVKQTDMVKSFLQENPNAEITISKLTSDDVSRIIDEIREKCGSHIQVKSYWRVYVEDPDTNSKITSWVDVETQDIVCGYRVSTSRTTTTLEGSKILSVLDAFCDDSGKLNLVISNDGEVELSKGEMKINVNGEYRTFDFEGLENIMPGGRISTNSRSSYSGDVTLMVVGPDNTVRQSVSCQLLTKTTVNDYCPSPSQRNCPGGSEPIQTKLYSGGHLDGCPYYDCCGDGACTNSEWNSNLCPEDCVTETTLKSTKILSVTDASCNNAGEITLIIMNEGGVRIEENEIKILVNNEDKTSDFRPLGSIERMQAITVHSETLYEDDVSILVVGPDNAVRLSVSCPSYSKIVSVLDASCVNGNIVLVLSNDGNTEIFSNDITIKVDGRENNKFNLVTFGPGTSITVQDSSTFYSDGDHEVLVISPDNTVRQTVHCSVEEGSRTISVLDASCSDGHITLVVSNDGEVDLYDVNLRVLIDGVDESDHFNFDTISSHSTQVATDTKSSGFGSGSHTLMLTGPDNAVQQVVYC